MVRCNLCNQNSRWCWTCVNCKMKTCVSCTLSKGNEYICFNCAAIQNNLEMDDKIKEKVHARLNFIKKYIIPCALCHGKDFPIYVEVYGKGIKVCKECHHSVSCKTNLSQTLSNRFAYCNRSWIMFHITS